MFLFVSDPTVVTCNTSSVDPVIYVYGENTVFTSIGYPVYSIAPSVFTWDILVDEDRFISVLFIDVQLIRLDDESEVGFTVLIGSARTNCYIVIIICFSLML